MKNSNRKFPNNFLWGASTSAFQVEGAGNSDGKGESVADVRTRAGKYMDSSVSVDEYHHLDEDISLMKKLGLKAYRFSISWTRVLPNGDLSIVNEKGVNYYHKLIDELVKNEIEPIVTMFHFDYPMALVNKYNGWVSKKSIKDFYNYADFLLKEYGDKVKYWLTINEQNVMVNQPEIMGTKANNKKELFQNAQVSNINMCLAQAEVFKMARERYRNIKIGPAISYITALPENGKSKSILLAKQLEDYFSFYLMDISIRGIIPQSYLNTLNDKRVHLDLSKKDLQTLKEGTANYLGVNWYCTTTFKYKDKNNKDGFVLDDFSVIKDSDLDYTKWGWSNDPVGLRYAMQQLNDRYPEIEVLVTECGWSDEDKLEDGKIHDEKRIKYFKGHIEQLRLAIKDGVHIIGFCPWSFIDLLSVNDGMNKRYGFVYVDRNNHDEKQLTRYEKDSFYFYQSVIKNNGLKF